MLQLLGEEGEAVTQSTLSRDFKTLGIGQDQNGVYVLLNDEGRKREILLHMLLKEQVDEINKVYKTFQIITKNESAALLGSMLKTHYPDKVMECLSSGNVLLVYVKDDDTKKSLISQLNKILTE